MRFVHTYNININDKRGVYTMGLSTCMFLCIKTTNSTIGWHFGAENMIGYNMDRITSVLDIIKPEDVLKVYLIPGVDRDNNLCIKSDCRTSKHRPDLNPSKSRDWFFNLVNSYDWSDKMTIQPSVGHYKTIVTFDGEPRCQRNDAFHDSMCVQDAETMT